MTQAAKAQEPSMEEILASIRRIIADDEPSLPQSRRPKLSTAPVASAAARSAGAAQRRSCATGGRRETGRYRRDAGGPRRGAGARAREGTAGAGGRGGRARTDRGDAAPPAPAFRKIEGAGRTSCSTRRTGARTAAAEPNRAPAPPPRQMLDRRADAVAGGRCRGRFGIQHARPYRAGAELQDAGGPRQGDAAADAAALARQQSADPGRTARARRRSSASRAARAQAVRCRRSIAANQKSQHRQQQPPRSEDRGPAGTIDQQRAHQRRRAIARR